MCCWIINCDWELPEICVLKMKNWLTFDLVLWQLLAGHRFLGDLELCGTDPSSHPLQHRHAEYCCVYDAQTCQHAHSSQGEVQIQQWNSVSHLMYLYMVPACTPISDDGLISVNTASLFLSLWWFVVSDSVGGTHTLEPVRALQCQMRKLAPLGKSRK